MIKNGLTVCCIFLFFGLFNCVYAAKGHSSFSLERIMKQGENVYITAKINAKTDIFYWFKKCMYNNLYTFYRVGLSRGKNNRIALHPNDTPEKILNTASSDNIGPFDIKGGGWCGGNHSFSMNNKTVRTASTVSYKIIVDGKELRKDTTILAHSITINVINHIQNPTLPQWQDSILSLPDLLCVEYVDYEIQQNSIQVSVMHQYMNQRPIVINKYYGMQSMFNNETEILTLNGKYTEWTPVSKVTRFNKRNYPYFRCFLERNDAALQSTYLCEEGLGMHRELGSSDIVFIGNSYGKSYHKLIANKQRQIGDTDIWKGIYTWRMNDL